MTGLLRGMFKAVISHCLLGLSILFINSSAAAQTECGTLVFARNDSFSFNYADCPRNALILRIDLDGAAFQGVPTPNKCKVAAVIDVATPGFYRLKPTVEYSPESSQSNETFFMEVLDTGEQLADFCADSTADRLRIPPCNPNAKTYKVVVPDSNPNQPDGVIRERMAGIFYLTPGPKIILFKHYELILDEYPEFLNPPGALPADFYESPESIHLLSLLVEPIDASFDVALQKTVDRTFMSLGDTATFSISVENLGSEGAFGLDIVDDVPPQLSVVSTTPPAAQISAGQIRWQLDSLTLASTAVFSYRSVLIETSPRPDTLLNIAEVTALCDTILSNNVDSATVVVTPAYDLALSKTSTFDSVSVGDTVNFDLTLTNLGPDQAERIVIEDVMPAGLSVISPPEFSGQDSLVWNIPVLAPGDSFKVTVEAIVQPELQGDCLSLNNIARVFSPFDRMSANNQSGALVTVCPPPPAPYDLVVTKSPGIAEIISDTATVIYRLVVINRGPGNATNALLHDLLPQGMMTTAAADSVSGNTLFWRIAQLAAGDSFQVLLTGRVSIAMLAPDSCLEVSNTAFIAANVDTNAVNDSASVLTLLCKPPPQPFDLLLGKSATNEVVAPLEPITYQLRLVNLGPGVADSVEIRDVLPERFLVSQPPDQAGADTLRWIAPTLSAGDTFNVTVVGHFDSTGLTPGQCVSVSNLGFISSILDTNAVNDTSSVVVQLCRPRLPTYDLALTKTVSSDTVRPGENFRYSLQVTNNGPSVANNIGLFDLLPPGVVLGDTLASGDTLSWMIDALTPLDTFKLDIDVRSTVAVDSGCVILTNMAWVAASLDTNAANDTAGAVVAICQLPRAYDLSFTKTASKTVFAPGDTIEYRLTVVNNGPDSVAAATVSDDLPEILVPLGHSRPLAWEIQNLAADDSVVLSFRAILNPDSVLDDCALQITNQAWVSSPGEILRSNDSSNVTVEINCCPANYDLQVVKRIGPAAVESGTEVVYTLVVKNLGPVTAEGVDLFDIMPEMIDAESFTIQPDFVSEDTLIWQFDNLPVSDSVVVSFTGDLSRMTGSGFVRNNARIIAKCDTNASNDTTSASFQVLPPPPPDDCSLTLRTDRNVFQPETESPLQIITDIDSADPVRLDIFDITGYHIRNISTAAANPGTNTFIWDGNSDDGQLVGSGVYIIVFRVTRSTGQLLECIQKVIVAR